MAAAGGQVAAGHPPAGVTDHSDGGAIADSTRSGLAGGDAVGSAGIALPVARLHVAPAGLGESPAGSLEQLYCVVNRVVPGTVATVSGNEASETEAATEPLLGDGLRRRLRY
jgi:hypothetical protein